MNRSRAYASSVLMIVVSAALSACASQRPTVRSEGGTSATSTTQSATATMCGASMPGRWQLEDTQDTAPNRGPNGVEAFERIEFTTNRMALVAPDPPVDMGEYHVVSDSPNVARLGGFGAETVEARCPDAEHLVIVDMPIRGRFIYRRMH